MQGGRAIAMLNGLIGSYDRPGTMVIPDKRGNKHGAVDADATAAGTLKQPRFDEKGKYPLGHGSGVYTQSFENLAAGQGPYQPKVGIVVFQNVLMSVPGSATVAKALAKLEMLVVAEYETVTALGRRLGLKTKDGQDFFRIGKVSKQPVENLTAWYEEFLSAELKTGAPNMTLAELKALPGAVWVDKGGTKFQKYATPLKPERLATAHFDGSPTADGTIIYDKPKGAAIGVVIGGKPVVGFETPSRRVEFVAKSLAGKKDADGKPDNPMLIHPATAQRFGVKDGETVWVESPYGRVKAKVKTTTRIHPEVVGVQHGFGHGAFGRLARGRGTSDSALRPTKSDPLSGQALHKEASVRIAKA